MKTEKTEWGIVTKSFKLKDNEFIDLPKIINAHIRWGHPDDLDKGAIKIVNQSIDHISEMDETAFWIYRQLMLEAGFFPVYVWIGEPEFMAASFEWVKPDFIEYVKP